MGGSSGIEIFLELFRSITQGAASSHIKRMFVIFCEKIPMTVEQKDAGRTLGTSDAGTSSTTRRQVSLAMVGNVITQPFAKITAQLNDVCDVSIEHLDFAQIVQTLEGDRHFDFLVLHLDHRWFFDVAPDGESIDRARDLAQRVTAWLDRGTGVVLLNTVPYALRSSVDSDLYQQIAAKHAIDRVFFDLAAASERVSVVDIAGALANIGYAGAFRERNRYLMQAPYTPAAAAVITKAYAGAVRTFLRSRRKAIVVDADNTLWGGIVGEVGPEGVDIDREYPGIIHFTLQQQLKRLRALGVLICAVTKNNEADFLDVFEKRAMPLTLADITAYRSNWEPKSENIRAIAEQLNLGLDAFVFLDDNPFEVEEVGTRLPQVDARLFPRDRPEAALVVLDEIESLHTRSLTAEDTVKAEQYQAEAERSQARSTATTLDEYLASLAIEVAASINDRAQLRRITQLTNKTNQFNLTCRRYIEAEIEQAMQEGHVYSFRVADRFGDMGLVAVAIVRNGEIENILMSCRALGRRVEIAILRYVSDRHPGVIAHYRAGPRNQMVAEFYDSNGFALLSTNDLERRYKLEQGPQNEQYFSVTDS